MAYPSESGASVRRLLVLALVAGGAAASPSMGQVIFSDSFDRTDAPSLLWENQRGDWVVSSGAYGATQPANSPPTATTLPFELADFEFECDIRAADDGGVWAHCDADVLNGVLLVLARGDVYWHVLTNGSYSGTLNLAAGRYVVGQDVHLRLTVVGDTYTAYVNGDFATSYTNTSYPTGRVGLYDFRNPNHNYDNVVLSGACAAGGCCEVISYQPLGASTCPTGSVELAVEAAGSGPLAYRWQIEQAPDVWVDLSDGPLTIGGSPCGSVSGTETAVLTIGFDCPEGSSNYRCVVTGACTPAASDPVHVTVCPKDYNCDGAADTADFFEFFAGFFATPPAADFNGDGVTDTADFFEFFAAFFGPPCS